jgi:predicted secreted protein
MSKINGTNFLLYVNSTLIAAQRDCTINFNQDLFDTTNKESSGWSEHGNGLRDGSIDFDALYSTTGQSADELLAFITGRTDVMAVVTTDADPFVMGGNLSNLSVNSPMEDAVSISGTFIASGGIYHLSGAYANLISSWSNVDYDTLTSSGTSITSAISDGTSEQNCESDGISITDEDEVKVIFFLTLNSGTAPTFAILDGAGGSAISNTEVAADGLNMLTLTATSTDASSVLTFYSENGEAANFETSNIYAFKV